MTSSSSKKNQIAALNFRKRLKDELEKRQAKNPQFSLRAFAAHLEMDASSLKKIMDGKRALGPKSIRKIGRQIQLHAEEIEAYVHAHSERRKAGIALVDDERQLVYRVLRPEEAELIANPASYALLELIKIPEFDFSLMSVANALGIDLAQAHDLVEAMKHHKWIERNKEGRWESLVDRTTVDPLDEATKTARRHLMKAVIEQSLDSYLNAPSEKRAHAGVTFGFDSSKLPQVLAKAKALTREFEEFIVSVSNEPDSVFRMQLGLFSVATVNSDNSGHEQ